MINFLKKFSILLFSRLIDFIFPPLCVLCSEPRSGDVWLCRECLLKLERNADSRKPCPRCSHNMMLGECTCTIAWDHYFERIYSFFDFDQTVQNIAHEFKYKGKKSLARYIGKRYGSRAPATLFESMDLIIPVPLHRMRQMSRGYNQAEYLARGILDGITSSITFEKNLLIRIKNTKTQTKLNKQQRQSNLAKAFMVRPKDAARIKGKGVLLVDDVVTTGATTDICTQVLLAAGAREVRVISLART